MGDYWFNRMQRTLISGEKKAKDYERTLKRAYEETKRAISKEVASFYQEYADAEGITLPAAYKRLKVDELIDFNQRSKEYLREVEAIENRSEPLQAYETQLKKLSGRAYMTRMDSLKANINHQLMLLTNKQDTGTGDTLDTIYDDSYYRTIYDLHKFTKTGVDFAQPGQSQLKAASKYKWNGDNYSSRIWKNKEKLTQALDQMIPQSFVRGFGSNELARELSDKLEVSYSSAVRLIRTEGRYVGNLGTLDAYRESGVVDEFMFMATLDDKTSEQCQYLDGKVFSLTFAEPGVTVPPIHPYCRSTTVPYFPDDDIDELIDSRVGRNEKGKTYNIGKYKTYEQWAKKNTTPEYVQTLLPEDSMPDIIEEGDGDTLADRVARELDIQTQYDLLPDELDEIRASSPYTDKEYIKKMEEWIQVGMPQNNEEDYDRAGKYETLKKRLKAFIEPTIIKDWSGTRREFPQLDTPEKVIFEAKRVMVMKSKAIYNAQNFTSKEADYNSFNANPYMNIRGVPKDWLREKGNQLIKAAKEISSNFKDGSSFKEVLRRSQGDAGGNCGEDEIMKIMMKGKENADLPQVVSKELYNKMRAKGYIEIHRGVKGKEYKKQFEKGDLYYGKGIYGNGTYTAMAYSTAFDYGDLEKDHVTSMILDPSARIISHSVLNAGMRLGETLLDAIDEDLGKGGMEAESLSDPGRQALAMGFDAIFHSDNGYLVVLNRSKLIIAEDED